MVPAEPADLALNTALLMSTVGAGLAEPRVEPVMAPQRNETVRLDPIPSFENLGDSGLQVVVTDRFGNAAQVVEGPDVAVQKHVLGFVQIRTQNPRPDAESRIKNNDTSVGIPANTTLASPKSASPFDPNG